MSDQKVVLITGASSGIGSATAEHLISRGYRVFGTARSPQKTATVSGVSLLPLDVTVAESVSRAVQAVLDAAGRIDVLVNNAGLGVFGAFEETSIEQAQALFDTNVFGVIRTSQAVLPHMRARRSGLIVNVSSVQGFIPLLTLQSTRARSTRSRVSRSPSIMRCGSSVFGWCSSSLPSLVQRSTRTA